MKTRSKYVGGNYHYFDGDYSPQSGVSLWETCPQLALLTDPAAGYFEIENFLRYAAAEWTITATEAGAGSASQALSTTEVGGCLLITNDNADNDMVQMQRVGDAFKLAASKPLWFEAKAKVSDATDSDFFVGLSVTDTSIIASAPSDHVSFLKADDAATVDFKTAKSSTTTTASAVATMVSDTFMRFGFFFDGAGSVRAYINGVLVATHTTNIPDTSNLRVSLAIQNGAAAIKTCTWDYFKVAQVF